MADPARVPDPRLTDPLDPVPPAGLDPLRPAADSRYSAANSTQPGVVNRVETRSGGSGIMIAAVVLILAVIAYFVFAPGTNTPAPTDSAVTTEPATPAAPAPEATAPTPPAAPAEPNATAPMAPAEPVAPAPTGAAPATPAEPAPATPAPAPAQ